MAERAYEPCIEACVRCAQACEHCASACLAEQDVTTMAHCIRLDADCAEICWGAASFMSRGSHFAPHLCAACADICEACAAECRQHEMDHCQQCAIACEECAQECRQMIAVA